MTASPPALFMRVMSLSCFVTESSSSSYLIRASDASSAVSDSLPYDLIVINVSMAKTSRSLADGCVENVSAAQEVRAVRSAAESAAAMYLFNISSFRRCLL
ncbi:MAG: hypothetical protein MJ079_05035 [Ruminococcus sp.]|nr:hypothetical protein [Ruminococcus sp.]